MKNDIIFTVESTSSQRPYGDTYKTYIVESTQDVQSIEAYCTKVLCPSISKEEFNLLPKDGEDFGNNFKNHYTELLVLNKAEFLSGDKNKVSYKVTQPSTC